MVKGRTVLRGQPEWAELAPHFTLYPSTRQLIVADIERVQTSCGFGVPIYEHVGERDLHFQWAEKQGEAGLVTYQQEHSLRSIDGLPIRAGTREGRQIDDRRNVRQNTCRCRPSVVRFRLESPRNRLEGKRYADRLE